MIILDNFSLFWPKAPCATAIFVGGASLLHLLSKFSVTITFTIIETEFGNSAIILLIPVGLKSHRMEKFAFRVQRVL